MNADSPAGAARLRAHAAEPSLIRVVNAERETLGLLQEWLGAAGYRVGGEASPKGSDDDTALVIVDVPFTRHGAIELLRHVSAQHPVTPILALSATFFANVKCGGDCARALGVARVLPKPVPRDTLVTLVEELLHWAK